MGIVREGARWNEGRKEGRKKKKRKEKKKKLRRRGSRRTRFVVLIIVSTSIVPARRVQVQPGTRSIPLPFDSSRSTARKKVLAHKRVIVFVIVFVGPFAYSSAHTRVLDGSGSIRGKKGGGRRGGGERAAKVCRSIFDYVRQRIRDIKDNYGLYRGNLYFSLSPRPALPTFAFLASSSSFVTCGRAGRPPTRQSPRNNEQADASPFHGSLTTYHSPH